jgi:hypothetical protein
MSPTARTGRNGLQTRRFHRVVDGRSSLRHRVRAYGELVEVQPGGFAPLGPKLDAHGSRDGTRASACDPLAMTEKSWTPPDAQPETSPEALESRFASLVWIMPRRSSIFGRLGILELDDGLVSLRGKSGGPLFSVPVATVEARRRPRRLSAYPYYFQVRAADRWWYLAGYGQIKYRRASTRELQERYRLRVLVPRPANMDVDEYTRITTNPAKHQVLWAICWVQTLNIAGARAGDG